MKALDDSRSKGILPCSITPAGCEKKATIPERSPPFVSKYFINWRFKNCFVGCFCLKLHQKKKKKILTMTNFDANLSFCLLERRNPKLSYSLSILLSRSFRSSVPTPTCSLHPNRNFKKKKKIFIHGRLVPETESYLLRLSSHRPLSVLPFTSART